MSTQSAKERRQWARDRIALSLNVLLLRTGTRALGCRLLDISDGGAAIALPPAASELIEKGYTPDIKAGDKFDILCSVETGAERKNFQFPARVAHIQDDVIGVAFTEGHSPVDEFLESYYKSRASQKHDGPYSRSLSDEPVPNAEHPGEESVLPTAASRTKASLGLDLTRKPSPAESASPLFGRLSLLVIGILLAGFGIYLYQQQQQLSDIRAAVSAVAGQVADHNERLGRIDNDKASIQQISDRLGPITASMTELHEQVENLSAATVPAAAERAVESAGPAPTTAEAARAKAAVANVDANQPAQTYTPPGQPAEPLDQEGASPAIAQESDARQPGEEASNTSPKLVKITADPVNVREEPGTEFPIAFRLNQDDRVAVLSIRGIWYQVETPDRRVGWVSSTYAQPVE
jgi:hypothetical protein